MTVLINEDKPFGSYDSKKALRKIGAEGNFLKVVKSYVEHRWCRTSRGNLRRVPLKAKNRTTMLIGKRQQGGQNEATANTGSFYTSNRRQHISSFRTSTGSAPKGEPWRNAGAESSVLLVRERPGGREGLSAEQLTAEPGGQGMLVCGRCWKLAHCMEEIWIPAWFHTQADSGWNEAKTEEGNAENMTRDGNTSSNANC